MICDDKTNEQNGRLCWDSSKEIWSEMSPAGFQAMMNFAISEEKKNLNKNGSKSSFWDKVIKFFS